jgi:hypothetical protein
MLYIAKDGNYGEAENLVIVNNESFDEHFYQYLEYCSDSIRSEFAKWFEANDHDFHEGDNSLPWECKVCEKYFEKDI